MKLIDILVRELPKRGGWPIDSDDERTLTASLPDICWGLDSGGYYAFRGPCDSVSHKLYEETLLALKSGWNGEGLPPVGCRVEANYGGEWVDVTVAYTVNHEEDLLGAPGNVVGFKEALVFDRKTKKPFWTDEFRPIRSEADKKRSDICDKIYGAMTTAEREGNRSDMAEAVYDAISAGKIPHIRID